jgi:hypothetical protein
MILPFILCEDNEKSFSFEEDTELEEYLYENYLSEFRYDARGLLVLNEASKGVIEKKIEKYLDENKEKLKDLSNEYWQGAFALGIYFLGLLFGPITFGVSIIISLITLLTSIVKTIFKQKEIHDDVSKLKSARGKVSRYLKQTKDPKVKEKLEDLKDVIDDALNYSGETVVVREDTNNDFELEDIFNEYSFNI